MLKLLDFLKFCWDYKDDHRFKLEKKVKYGYTNYSISWEVDHSMIIHIDSRNQVIEVQLGYNSPIIINDPYLFLDLYDKCEMEYDNILNLKIESTIDLFFEKLKSDNKDLSRKWRLDKMDFLEDK